MYGPVVYLVVATLFAGLLNPNSLHAGQQHHPHSTRYSFHAIAANLLASQSDVDLKHIQIYPTNQYTPSVHRILQISANLHEAARVSRNTSHTMFPTVRRPVFHKHGSNVFIAGYRTVNAGSTQYAKAPLDLNNPTDRAALEPNDNVVGVPWIIGARKGFPNFNELAVENIFEISRLLELSKASATDVRPNQTNQMFLISLNSAVGVEAWNSYRDPFQHDVEILTTNHLEITVSLTNPPSGTGSSHTFRITLGSAMSRTNWTGTGWPAMVVGNPEEESFVPTMVTNFNAFTNAVFRGDGRLEFSTHPAFDRSSPNTFPTPDITLAFTSRLQFVMRDRTTGRVLDYVNLVTSNRTNLTAVMANAGDQTDRRLWDTNHLGGDTLHNPTRGVINQLLVSAGFMQIGGNDWRNYGLGQPSGVTRSKAETLFRDFWIGSPGTQGATNRAMRTPFTPTRRIMFYRTLQANDPLVHYNAWDVEQSRWYYSLQPLSLSIPPRGLSNIGRLNERYEPWGGNPESSAQSGSSGRRAYDLRFKDPLVGTSDDWNFPTGKPLRPTSLGRIHRGTPWQTLYFKAGELSLRGRADLRAWGDWTGIANVSLAAQVSPQADWNLAAQLVRILWPEKPHRLVSVNEPNRERWLRALDGIHVLTNTVPDEDWYDYSPDTILLFDRQAISRESDQAQRIVDGIEADRATEPDGYFRTAGGILAVEQLSTQSPFLNLSDVQRERGITDEAYEAIALQLLPKLRPDSLGRFTTKNGRPIVWFSGVEGVEYIIECSTDLVRWRPVKRAQVRNGSIEVGLHLNPDRRCVFYRSVMVEHDPDSRRKRWLQRPHRGIKHTLNGQRP